MAFFKGKLAEVTSSRVWMEQAGRHRPIWSFDNDKIHQNRLALAFLKINRNNRYPLPPNSPDMHRVVERCIGRLKAAFSTWLYDHPGKRTMRDYQNAFKELFFSTQTADVIDKDVRKLPTLYPYIIKANGGWPPKRQL